MKIALSSRWRISMILIMISIMIFWGIAIDVWDSNYIKSSFIFLILSMLYTITMLSLLFLIKRVFTYVICTENTFTSYLLKKELCVVDKNKPVYYAVFVANEAMHNRRKYIVISNETFEYYDVPILRKSGERKTFFSSYDLKSQIVMPYDEITIAFIDHEKWICVN